LQYKIAILGGTGSLGKGLALRLIRDNDVTIGSRVKEKALTAAKEIKARAEVLYKSSGYRGMIRGEVNSYAVKENEFIILAIKAEQIDDFLKDAENYAWSDKTVLSPVTRMKKVKDVFDYYPFNIDGKRVSAAEYIQQKLNNATVVSALQLVPASALWSIKDMQQYDVPAAGEKDAFNLTIKAFAGINSLKFLYAGPLQVSYLIESTLPLLLNLAIRNGFKNPGIRVV
jgi:NADPH-dependent F420 reductase